MWEKGEHGEVRVFLVHPGGPYNAKKDEGVWGIPKGLREGNEDMLTCARREFSEETGFPTPDNYEYIPLGNIIKNNGTKVVHAWAFEKQGVLPPFTSNTFQMEWPPKSGKLQDFPEADRGEFFELTVAKHKINSAELPFLDRLGEFLSLR